MQEFFEKIKERLNKENLEFMQQADIMDCIDNAIDQVAEEYNLSLTNNLTNNGWIPCSERSPEIAGYSVLATLENTYGQKRVTHIFTGYGLQPFWHCNNLEYDLNVWKVIAWMPLPEPYQPKGE